MTPLKLDVVTKQLLKDKELNAAKQALNMLYSILRKSHRSKINQLPPHNLKSYSNYATLEYKKNVNGILKGIVCNFTFPCGVLLCEFMLFPQEYDGNKYFSLDTQVAQCKSVQVW